MHAKHPLSQQIASKAFIWSVSVLSGSSIFLTGILMEWLVYHDWLHRHGPLRLVGSLLAAILMFVFTLRWQAGRRERKLEMLHRFETIARMNDRIRNALQVIECATYATNPNATAPVRDAVDTIETVLEEVLEQTQPALSKTENVGATNR